MSEEWSSNASNPWRKKVLSGELMFANANFYKQMVLYFEMKTSIRYLPMLGAS